MTVFFRAYSCPGITTCGKMLKTWVKKFEQKPHFVANDIILKIGLSILRLIGDLFLVELSSPMFKHGRDFASLNITSLCSKNLSGLSE